jgi:hypothetical protein
MDVDFLTDEVANDTLSQACEHIKTATYIWGDSNYIGCGK